MTGIVHQITTRRTFDFTNLTNAAFMEVSLVRAFDVTDAKTIDLVVRVHSRNVTGGASVEVIARAISLTGEEPDTDFLSAGSDLATIPLNTAAPIMHVASLTPPWGSMIRLLVKGTGATAQSASVTISVELVVRDN